MSEQHQEPARAVFKACTSLEGSFERLMAWEVAYTLFKLLEKSNNTVRNRSFRYMETKVSYKSSSRCCIWASGDSTHWFWLLTDCFCVGRCDYGEVFFPAQLTLQPAGGAREPDVSSGGQPQWGREGRRRLPVSLRGVHGPGQCDMSHLSGHWEDPQR